MQWLKSGIQAVLSQMRLRMRALFRRSDVERELDEELRFHIEKETEKNVREGLDPRKARRRAMLAFGGVERHKEAARDARGVRWIENAVKDFRYGLRRLLREPGYSVPVVATLAIGIGAAAAIFALVYGVLLRPLPYPDADRLVTVRHEATGIELPATGASPGLFVHYREHSRVFEDMGLYLELKRRLTGGDAPQQVDAAMASPGVFSVLSATPHLGRLPIPGDVTPPARAGGIVISYDLWTTRFGGDPDIIGREIEYERIHARVIGVMERGFHFPNQETQLWIGWPQETVSGSGLGHLNASIVARVSPGVSSEVVNRDLARLIGTLPEAYPDLTSERLRQIGLIATAVPLKQAIVGDAQAELLLLLGGAAFLLLIMWANAAVLSLVRAEGQRREVAVERALGALGGRVASRFLSESVILGVAGGGLGLLLAYLAVDARFGFQPGQVPRLGAVGVGVVVGGMAAGVSVASSLLVGLVSFLNARRPNLSRALAGGLGRMTAGRTEQAGRRLLVGLQIGLALTLLISSALLAKSYWELRQIELGFEPEGVLTFHLPISAAAYGDYDAAAGLHAEILDRIRALPGVEAAGAVTESGFPLSEYAGGDNERQVTAAGAAEADEGPSYSLWGFATPDYFEALGIPLLRGRSFRAGDWALDAPAVILSEPLAELLFPGQDPIGLQVRLDVSDMPPYTVVGVVGGVPARTIREGASNMIYFPNVYPMRVDAVLWEHFFYIPIKPVYTIRTRVPPTSLVSAVRRILQEADPKLLMTHIRSLNEVVADSMARVRVVMLLLLVAAGTALFLGIMGVYGILAYAVRQRTSELGIRIALGATPAEVVGMVVRQGALLAFAGIGLGLVTALAVTRFLRGLLYEISPTDPLIFATMAALLFVVALAASYLPAHRAGRIDPVRALKSE